MDNSLILELVGYAASALIAVSLMMSSILRLRLINLAGAAIFATYGLLIRAYPVAVLNGLIVLVNAYHLLKMLRTKQFFQLLKLRPESDYLRHFLNFYRTDIARILPDFSYRPVENQMTLFILRDCAPVGVFIAEQKPDGVLRVILDFVIPGYRDLKLGRFLFVEQAEVFRQRGVEEIVIAPRSREFGAYLIRVGFEQTSRKHGLFRIRFGNKSDFQI